MLLSFLVSILIIMAVDYLISFVFVLTGLPYYAATIVSALIIAFIFTYLSYRRHPNGVFKNPAFHRSFATRFVILMIISFIFNYL
ncbi:MAG: hypothetical protein ACOX3K_00730 [Bacilli bacterium]|jgi:hypothetical protein